MESVKLVSCDGIVFQVDVKIAKKSSTLKLLLETCGSGDADDLIPLPTINARTLSKIIEWANYHKNDPDGGESQFGTVGENHRSTQLWDSQFLAVEQPLLFDIILAANYLDMKNLLDVACQTVAKMIENKSPEQLRAEFHIENDFTLEEEERNRKRHSWGINPL